MTPPDPKPVVFSPEAAEKQAELFEQKQFNSVPYFFEEEPIRSYYMFEKGAHSGGMLREKFLPSEPLVFDPATLSGSLLRAFSRDDFEEAFSLVESLSPDECAEYKSWAIQSLISSLNKGIVADIERVRRVFNITDADLQSPLYANSLRESLIEFMQHRPGRADYVRVQCAILADLKQDLGWRKVQESIRGGWSTELSKIYADYDLHDKPTPKTQVFRAAAIEGLNATVGRGIVLDVKRFNELLKFEQEEIEGAVPKLLITLDHISKVNAIGQILGIDPNLPVEKFLSGLSSADQRWIKQFELKTLGDVLQFRKVHFEYVQWLRINGNPPQLTLADLECLRSNETRNSGETLPVSDAWAEQLKRKGLNLQEAATKRDFDGIYKALCSISSTWQEVQFESVCKVLSAREVLEFAYGARAANQNTRADFQTLDLRHFVKSIVRLMEASGKDAKGVRAVVDQIKMDGGLYGESINGSLGYLREPALEFSKILERNDFKLDAVRKRVAESSALEGLVELADHFPDKETIFSSWKNIKRFDKLCRVLKDNAFREHLVKLKDTNPALYRHTSALLFHPDSNIDIETIKQFCMIPGEYFTRKAEYTNHSLAEAIRPAQMVGGEIAYLDLTAEQLRDALIDGTYDQLQTFVPMQITYQIPKSGAWYSSTMQAVKEALGERRAGIRGHAQNPPKLFKLLQTGLAERGYDLKSFISGSLELSQEAEAWVMEAVYDGTFGLRDEMMTMVATLYPTSDPHGIISCGDTACCMPMSDGKFGIYFSDPNAVFFTVQLRLQDGSLRTIAQSVFSWDIPIGTDYQEVQNAMESSLTNIAQHIEYPNHTAPLAAVVDNIEPGKNFTTAILNDAVLAVYRDLLAEYTARFGDAQGVKQDEAFIGIAYTEARQGISKVPDRTMSVTSPIGYSDRTVSVGGLGVFGLPLKSDRWSFQRTIKFIGNPDKPTPVKRVVDNAEGIRPLTFTDIVPVAYLQGKMTPHRVEGIQTTRMLLIGKDVNNTAKNRANLSFKSSDSQGRMHGYLVAYEGTDSDNKPVIYFREIVADTGETAHRLIDEFAAACLNGYPKKGTRPKIVSDVYDDHKVYLSKLFGKEFKIIESY